MKKHTYIIGLTGLLSVLYACNDQSAFTISGDVDNAKPTDKVYLMEADSTEIKIIDSTSINGQHTFQFKHSSPYANLYKVRIGSAVYDVIAKNGDAINFKTNLSDSSHVYEVSGSAESEKIQEFNKMSNVYSDKNAKLANEYQAKVDQTHKTDSLLNIYRPVFEKNIDDYSKATLDFINNNKTSLAGFYAAMSLDQYKYEQQLVAYADEVKNEFKGNPAVQKFVTQMEIVKPVSVGHKAPAFTAISINGKTVNLADYKGKYVMLDFWASWCGPCRQENPNVVKQYSAFKDKGFNILGISLDEEKQNWQKAINDDHIIWQQVSDLKKFDGPTERLYHIEAIPSNFIIDPAGNIVAKNVTGGDLEAFLNKTFNKVQ